MNAARRRLLTYLYPNQPLRSRTGGLNPLYFDSGATVVEFNLFGVVNEWPANAKTPPAIAPPLHWHYYQDEIFRVVEGKAGFVVNGKTTFANEGENVMVQAGDIHTFWNATNEEKLVIHFGLEPRHKNDERFFRNMQSYRDDCKRAGIPRCMPQVLLFNRAANVIPVPFQGPNWVTKPVGLMMNFWGGLVLGKWILGLRECYPEYTRGRPWKT